MQEKNIYKRESWCWKQLLVAALFVVCFATLATAAEPSINDVIPNSGAVGTEVFIRGTNFIFPNRSSNKVNFRGVKAAVVEASSSTMLRVEVPSGASNGPVTVINSNGEGKSPNNFTVTTPIPSNKGAIGSGDRIRIKNAIEGFKPTGNKCFGNDSFGATKDPVNAQSQYYAPAGSVLTVDSDVFSDADSIRKVRVSFRGCRLLTAFLGSCQEPAKDCSSNRVVEGNEYEISAEKLEKTATSTIGFDYGTLVVPFKYQLHDNTITGNTTVGQYLGYKLSSTGLSVMPVISAGLGVVSISQKDSQQNVTTSSAPSFSVAYGLIVNILKNGLFQAGIMSGWDWAGKGSQYKYEGKPWISISLGTNWTN